MGKRTGTLTVRRREESWSVSVSGRRGEGLMMAQKIMRWLDTFSSHWPEDERTILKTRLAETIESNQRQGRAPKRIEIDVSDLGTAAPPPGGSRG